jgi:hypothetical protein
MASRLEAQGVSDKSKWQAEQESWDRDRETLNARILQLEKERAEAIGLAVSECQPLSSRAPSESHEAKAPLDLRKTSALNAGNTISPPPASLTPIDPTSPTSAPRMRTGSSTESISSASGPAKDELLEGGSIEELRVEIIRLRKGCAEIEVHLTDLKSEGKRIDQVMQKYQTMGQRVTTKAEVILSIASSARPLASE